MYAQIKNILGESPKVAFTKKSGDGTILTRGFLKNGFKNIVAIGGDGLINEVANGFFICTVSQFVDKSNFLRFVSFWPLE
ncbi:MAG: diacylglycerol kinase family protein [Nitrososphaeraceae archaeon]